MTTQLCVLADVKTWANVNVNTDDALLTRLIAAASELVKSILNRDIGLLTYTDVLSGNGKQRIALRYYPVVTVSAVLVGDVAQVAATSTTSTGYRFDDYSVILNNRVFDRGLDNVSITYTAGYAAVPPDLAQACVEIVGEAYRRKERIGESSKGLPPVGQTTYSLRDVPATAMTTIKSYTKRTPI